MKTNARTIVPAMLLCMLSGLVGGCAFISFAVASFVPKPKIAAEYELPKGRRVLVFSDDLAYDLRYPPLKRILAEKISHLLEEHHLAAETVPYQQVEYLKNRVGDRWYDVQRGGMSVGDVAAELGADLAIYVNVSKFTLKDRPASPLWQGELTTLVKVVDSTGRRLWPTDQADGRQVRVTTPTTADQSEMYGIALTDELTDLTAHKVVNLFRSHRSP